MSSGLNLPDLSQYDPSSQSSSDPLQMTQMERWAQSLFNSGQQGYGVVPDPQLMVEALQTGAAPDIAQTLSQGDPRLATVLSSQPLGQSTPQANAVPQTPSWQPDAFKFDPQQYANMVKMVDNDHLGVTQKVFNGWQGFGDVPVASIGWYNHILSADPTTVKRWQQYLADHGFYGTTDSKGKFTPGEANGYWSSPGALQAFQQWTISYFGPTAMYSKDQQQSSSARILLSQLGYNPDAVLQDMGNDPTFRSQVVINWLNAQGPKAEQRKSIDAYADAFGADNMPPEIANLRDTWLSGVTETAKSLFNNTLGLLLPGWQFKDSSLMASIRKATPEEQAAYAKSQQGKTQDGLTAAEQQALNPTIQAIHNSSGYLSFLNTWDRARAKAFLTASYWLGDAVTGKGVENPFDAHSNARQGAVAHEDNIAAGLLGDDWVKAHPSAATFLNFGLNMADDPTFFIPVAGGAMEGLRAARAGEGLMGSLSAARAGAALGPQRIYSPRAIRDSFQEGGVKQIFDDLLNPIRATQRDIANHLGTARTTVDVLRALDEDDPAKLPIARKLMEAQSSEERLQIIRETDGWSDKLYDMNYLVNHREHMKVLANMDRLSQDKQVSLIHQLGTEDKSTRLHLEDHHRIESAETLEYAGMAAGMDSAKLTDLIERFVTADTEMKAHEVNREFREELDRAFDKTLQAKGGSLADFQDWVYASRSGFRQGQGRPAPQAMSTNLYAIEHDPAKPAVETSYAGRQYQFKDVPELGLTKADLEEKATFLRQAMMGHEQELQQVRDNMIAERFGPNLPASKLQEAIAAVEQTPEWQLLQSKQDSYLKQLREELDALPGRTGSEGTVPAPATSRQMRTWGHIRYSPYEMLAYRSPVMRRAEWVQRKMGVDHAMGMFKGAVLSKPGTSARIAFGDETSRFLLSFLTTDLPTFGRYVGQILRRKGVDPLPEDMQMDLFRLFEGWQDHAFVPYTPGDPGYAEGMKYLVEHVYGPAPETQVWVKAMEEGGAPKAQKALAEWLSGDSKEAQEFRDSQNIEDPASEKGQEQVKNFAAFLHHERLSFTAYRPGNTDVFDWMKAGKIDEKRLKELVHTNAYSNPYTLPRIQARRLDATSLSSRGKVSEFFNWYHHNVTQAWVNKARARGFWQAKEMYARKLKAAYPHQTDEWIDRESMGRARRWVKRNTYQGTRSLAGTATRTIAPFFGASANANRFYLRLMRQNPYLLNPTLHGLGWIQQQQDQGGVRIPVPGLGAVLEKFGMTAGDDLSFDPFSMFFLTREGFGGFSPAAGPVFNVPMRALGAIEPGLANAIAQLPSMNYVSQNQPLLPWLERLTSGVSMALGGPPVAEGVPLIGRQAGYYGKQTDAEIQAAEAQHLSGQGGGPATAEGAQRDVGLQNVLSGVAGYVSPVTVSGQNDLRGELDTAQREIDNAGGTPAARAAAMQAHPAVAPILQYFDPSTPVQGAPGKTTRQSILQEHPWVLPYTVGRTASTVDNAVSGAEPSMAAFMADVESGRLRTLSPVEYLQKMQRSEEINHAWTLYDQLQASYQDFLATSGVSSTSAAARLWRQQNFDPVLQAIGDSHPYWYQQFVKTTSKSPSGLEVGSLPLKSLMSFEVIPQNPALETKQSLLWRAALIRRDEAVTAISAIVARHGSSYEKQMVMDGLAQELDSLASMDPKFAAQLSKYRFRQMEDLVNYEAGQIAA